MMNAFIHQGYVLSRLLHPTGRPENERICTPRVHLLAFMFLCVLSTHRLT